MKKLLIFIFVLSLNSLYAQVEIDLGTDVTVNSVGTINELMRGVNGIIQGGKDITASGILRIPIVFVRFADDNEVTNYWPIANELPDWAETFVDFQIPSNGIYANLNLSKYFDLSSGGDGNGTLGQFKVIGDVYFVVLPYTRQYYSITTAHYGDAWVSLDAIDILDTQFGVDFRIYDNWAFKVGGDFYHHVYDPYSPGRNQAADGILDFMVICWRTSSIGSGPKTGGIASLGFDDPIIKDGITIDGVNGIRGFNAKDYGREKTTWVVAHEFGHHLFGCPSSGMLHFNGGNNRYGNIHRFALMTTGEGHQFSAYERYRLGWLNPITITSNSNSVVINETHKSSANNAVIIPLTYNTNGYMSEYFLLENYHSISAYPNANPFLTYSLFNHIISKGLIVYHVCDEDFDWPTNTKIDIESAEGLYKWNVVEGAATLNYRYDDLIAPGDPDPLNGYDDRESITAKAGSTNISNYLALTPGSTTDYYEQQFRRYSSDDKLGDQEDLFSPEYNKVFTIWSNPSSIKNNGSSVYKGFEITSYNSTTHQYTINVGVDYSGVIGLSPSKPQKVQVVQSGYSAYITWNLNSEPDMMNSGGKGTPSKYKIYRATTTGGEPTTWTNIATVNYPTSSWTDVNMYITGSGDRKVFYSVTAVDNTNKESVKSDYDWLPYDNELQKRQYNNESIKEYKLYNNYPNPFNPTTNISFQLPKGDFVSLKIYNLLGETVAEIVNQYMEAGLHTIPFNAENLPSGLYIYKMECSEYMEVKKMMLMK